MPIAILHREESFVVCCKPVGLSSEGPGLPQLLAEELGEREVFCVHRLDTAVGGVMVYALSKAAAASLSRQVAQRTLDKTYLAVCASCPEQPEGEMNDLLFKDARSNRSYVVNRPRKGVKDAKLDYRVLARAEDCSLVRVHLHTGRTHQIRVQFASRQLPLLGDGKYGSRHKGCPIALWSHQLCFDHPVSGQSLCFSALPGEGYPWDLFREVLHA